MPNRYILHSCVILFLLTSNIIDAQINKGDNSIKKGNRYHIHIGTYEKLIPTTYFQKAGIGKVKYHKDANSFHRYYLGFYDSETDAKKNCEEAVKQGFPNAKVVSNEDDKIAQILDERSNTYKFYEITYDELFLRSVLFEFNSDNLDQAAKELLAEVETILLRNPTWIVQLSGHSDSKGTPETNIKVSKNRVRSVKKRLLDHGITSDRIKTRVFGEAAPMAKNREKTGEDVPSGRQLNRRVCVGIYNENGEMVNIKDSTIVPSGLELGN